MGPAARIFGVMLTFAAETAAAECVTQPAADGSGAVIIGCPDRWPRPTRCIDTDNDVAVCVTNQTVSATEDPEIPDLSLRDPGPAYTLLQNVPLKPKPPRTLKPD